MAITKLMNMKENKGITKGRHLKNAIKYTLNEAKTTQGLYVNSNCGCDAQETYQSMMDTKRQSGKEQGRQGYHFVISFLPGEADEETAYRIAGKFASEYLKDQYDYVYAVHNDKGHIHAHIIFNSVSYGGYKYHYANGEWEREIQPITNRLCEEQGLSTIFLKEGGTGKSYGEWLAEKEGEMNWRKAIRIDLDAAVRACGSYGELLAYMKEDGYKIREGNSKKHGAYLSIRPPNGKYAYRTYTMGKNYGAAELKKRVAVETPVKTHIPPPRLKTCRLPTQRYQTASAYQLDHFRRYHQVRHFYNHRGWQYRQDLYKIGQLYQQCSYLLKNGIHSREAVEGRLQELQYQERELYRYRRELQTAEEAGVPEAEEPVKAGLAGAEEGLKHLRTEKGILRRIQKWDVQNPGPQNPAPSVAPVKQRMDKMRR